MDEKKYVCVVCGLDESRACKEDVDLYWQKRFSYLCVRPFSSQAFTKEDHDWGQSSCSRRFESWEWQTFVKGQIPSGLSTLGSPLEATRLDMWLGMGAP